MPGDLAGAMREAVARATQLTFPSPRYRDDPVAFFRDVLGVEPWSRQIEIIEAVRDNPRVAIKSGHKVSKSHTAAGIALWFYCSFEDARAVMTSTTSRQVDQILWRELRMMRARSGRCVACKEQDPDGLVIRRPCPHSAIIEGEQGDLARTGLKSADFREIVGFTAREAEAVAGISGRNLLYIPDEASGIPDVIFEAIEGNRAGGARVVMFGNPTRNEGEFFEAFNSKSHLYKTLTVSSEETPNVIAGRDVIPGLATRGWIEEKRIEWGEDSPLYTVRVKGNFAIHEEGRIFSLHRIAEAEQRWHDTPPEGRLFVGIDPAGASGTGDETAICCRRGRKVITSIETRRGMDEDQILIWLLHVIGTHALPRETPVVVIDREGEVGSKLAQALRAYLRDHPAAFELVTVRASDRAVRQPHIYDRIRDELAANLDAWLRDGGAIVEDIKLEKELHPHEWKQAINGRLKLMPPKDQLRKILGRSPDRFDALCLSTWEPLSLRAGDDLPTGAPTPHPRDASAYAPALDPYAGANTWGRRQ